MIHTINVCPDNSFWLRLYRDQSMEFHRYKFVDSLRILKQTYDTRGYLYINDVYEAVGVKWDPCNENKVFIRGDGDNLRLDVSKPTKIHGVDAIVVTINYNDH